MTKDNQEGTCNGCSSLKKHIDNTTKSRENYIDDGNQPEEAGNDMYCPDLEKVVICHDCNRLNLQFSKQTNVYNKSLVATGKKIITKCLPLLG